MSWKIVRGTGPVVATAIHAGHEVRPNVLNYVALDEPTRLREEDPYTDQWTDVAENRIIVDSSRFEFDLNRPFERAVYLKPEDAWGLNVWKEDLPDALLKESLDKWKSFYQDVGALLDDVHEECGNFVVLDIHSYCHRRDGPDGPVAPLDANPSIDIGTTGVDRDRWYRLVRRFIDELRSFDFDGERLDVGENAKFQGGHFPRWIKDRYGNNACAIAIEFKKTFVDEWTGELNVGKLELLKSALASTLPGIVEELGR